MKNILLTILLTIVCCVAHAADADTIQHRSGGGLLRSVGKVFTGIFKGFNDVDTNYIEPQQYNFTAMLQNTNTYESYRIESKSGQYIRLAPKPTTKIGPYVGWRWLVLGYTIDLNHLSNGQNKKEFDLSLYSSLVGIDIYYRKTGDDYLIKGTNILENGNSRLDNVPFSGLNATIKGFDLYYIFNHRKFSYPAAFSQSTRQKRSRGSALVGIGYTSHSIKLDYDQLKTVIEERVGKDPQLNENEVKLDSGLQFNNVKYYSYSVSGGYAYNWVFARNCLFSASLSVALAYKKSTGNITGQNGFSLRDFDFKNINFDGIGRFGLVWNNRRWYMGASTILHTYSYKKRQLSVSNVFGSLNIYAGFNFGRKKK